MANKTVLKKEKNLNSRREVVTSHPVMRALIYSFVFLNRQNRIQRTNAYAVKKIYLFLESNDQYGRKKNFSTVVLLYDERIFIDILKNQQPNVNFYRKVLQTCSHCKRKYNLKKSALLFVVTFDENSSPFLSYRPVGDIELVLRDAANVHPGKKKPLGCLNLIVLEDV